MIAISSHISCSGARPRTTSPKSWRTSVLRQSLHQQQAEAAEQPDRRQQHLVGPAAGEDLRRVRREQRAEVDQQQVRVGDHDLGLAEPRPERRAERQRTGDAAWR